MLLIKSVWRVITQRPAYFFQYARGYLLFTVTRVMRVFIHSSNIQLGRNLRLQKLRSLSTERPYSRIKIGDHCIIYENARLEAFGSGLISVGSCSVLGDVRIVSRSKITLGERVITSWNVFIQDFDPHPINPALRAVQVHNICAEFRPSDGSLKSQEYPGRKKPDFKCSEISIGNDVWIGANVIILKGSKIGDGCTVAAGAVVVGGEYPDQSIIAGNPARIVKNVSQSL